MLLGAEPVGLTRMKLMGTVIVESAYGFIEISFLGSCVCSCLRRPFISSMVDSLPKPQFQQQLEASI